MGLLVGMKFCFSYASVWLRRRARQVWMVVKFRCYPYSPWSPGIQTKYMTDAMLSTVVFVGALQYGRNHAVHLGCIVSVRTRNISPIS